MSLIIISGAGAHACTHVNTFDRYPGQLPVLKAEAEGFFDLSVPVERFTGELIKH